MLSKNWLACYGVMAGCLAHACGASTFEEVQELRGAPVHYMDESTDLCSRSRASNPVPEGVDEYRWRITKENESGTWESLCNLRRIVELELDNSDLWNTRGKALFDISKLIDSKFALNGITSENVSSYVRIVVEEIKGIINRANELDGDIEWVNDLGSLAKLKDLILGANRVDVSMEEFSKLRMWPINNSDLYYVIQMLIKDIDFSHRLDRGDHAKKSRYGANAKYTFVSIVTRAKDAYLLAQDMGSSANIKLTKDIFVGILSGSINELIKTRDELLARMA